MKGIAYFNSIGNSPKIAGTVRNYSLAPFIIRIKRGRAERGVTERVPQHLIINDKSGATRIVRLSDVACNSRTKHNTTNSFCVPGVWFFARQRT